MRVAFVACSSWALTAFVVLPLMFTGVPPMGQLAWANDVQDRIDQAVAPLTQDLKAIKDKLDAQDRRSKELQILDLRQKVFETRVAQCKSRKFYDGNNPYTARLKALVDDLEDLTNRQYRPPLCEDL